MMSDECIVCCTVCVYYSHISEHLHELKEAVNVSAMSPEELEFHYFKCVYVTRHIAVLMLFTIYVHAALNTALYNSTIVHVAGDTTSVVISEISRGKFPEIYYNLSGNFRKFVK